ncbi:APC family permease [Micromonospora eburnea]|uniref:Amino acid/polyamine/organocation transporter, APC superfamily (TC 2.A.3) n=1 Tax=Micromonospora eburnea TaxID=227316 RepID=A0A1C6UX73_9ACTN|nr:APC family permease [Micromonospora eburnea]SCL58620.1 amino acid/polyamine/organocation transporter, APC superfamily (TC 2.A.3) [Micromonospora eburnea]
MSSPPDTVSTVLARGRLGTWTVVFFVIAAAAPLTVVAGGATTGYAVTGVLGIPVSYLAVASVLALFAVGYVNMSRRIVNAGAFYTYVTRGFGRPSGVGAAFVAILGYNAMQIGLYGGFGAVLSGFLADRGGDVPWWLCAYAAWAAVALLGVVRIDINGKVLATMLVAEVVVALVYDAVMVAHPAGGRVTFDTLSPSRIFAAGIGAALVTAITGFVGFESTVVLSEETKDPKRTVARATYIAVAITGLLYGASAWAMSVATGPDRIVDAASTDSTDLIFNLVSPYVGSELVTIGRLLFITSLFAALLSFHHTVARYLFALGRERVLPAILGRTSRRTGAPKFGSIIQTVLAGVVLAGYTITDADPIVHLFFWVTVTGGLGVLILMTVTSASVVAFFIRHRADDGMWRTRIAPALAALALGAILYVTVSQFDTLLGVEPTSPLRWWFPASYGIAAAAGLLWALILRATRPDVYRSIGLGAESATAPLRVPDPVRQSA